MSRKTTISPAIFESIVDKISEIETLQTKIVSLSEHLKQAKSAVEALRDEVITTIRNANRASKTSQQFLFAPNIPGIVEVDGWDYDSTVESIASDMGEDEDVSDPSYEGSLVSDPSNTTSDDADQQKDLQELLQESLLEPNNNMLVDKKASRKRRGLPRVA